MCRGTLSDFVEASATKVGVPGGMITSSNARRARSAANYLIKLRYDARASICFGDNLPAISGIGGSAAAS